VTLSLNCGGGAAAALAIVIFISAIGAWKSETSVYVSGTEFEFSITI
jgi:hypothetical protein